MDLLSSPQGLTLPIEVHGNLSLKNITSAKGLRFPEIVKKDLDLGGIISADGLILSRFFVNQTFDAII
jgi:hypothetical protein